MKRLPFFFFIFLVAIFSGGAAGIITATLLDQSMDNYIVSLEEQETFPLISSEKPRPLPGTYEEALQRVHESRTSIASFKARTAESVSPQAWQGERDVLGLGVVITNDGWILFHKSTFETLGYTAGDVWLEGEVYQITETIEDALTDMVLVHVDVQNASAIAFGTTEEAQSGEMIFSLTPWDALRVMYLIDADYERDALPHLAAEYADGWLVSESGEFSAPVFNAFGEYIGMATQEGEVIPMHHMYAFIQKAFEADGPEHAALGVRCVDMTSFLTMPEAYKGDSTEGCFISAEANQYAVLVNSEAYKAGFKFGDVIVAVDEVRLTEGQSLAELLSQYDVGDLVAVTVQRNGELLIIEVPLEKYE